MIALSLCLSYPSILSSLQYNNPNIPQTQVSSRAFTVAIAKHIDAHLESGESPFLGCKDLLLSPEGRP